LWTSAVEYTAAGDTAKAWLMAAVKLLSVNLWVVRLTDQAAVDDGKPIPGDETHPADSADETVDVVGILSCPHHHL